MNKETIMSEQELQQAGINNIMEDDAAIRRLHAETQADLERATNVYAESDDDEEGSLRENMDEARLEADMIDQDAMDHYAKYKEILHAQALVENALRSKKSNNL